VSERSARIGWRGTRTDISNWSRRAGTMRRSRGRWWCGRGRMGRSGSSIEVGRCDGRRSRRRPDLGSSRTEPSERRRSGSRSGRRRRIIRGDRQLDGRWKGTRPGSPGGRRGACPPLRPKRSPCGLARAALRPSPTRKSEITNQIKREKQEPQKGDTSNELTKGTFLKSFDTEGQGP